MSNNPYDEGRCGGGPPASGADHAEWWRGYQERLRGLQQPSSGDSAYGADGGTETFPFDSPPAPPYSAPGSWTGGGGDATGTGNAGSAGLGILGAGCLLTFFAPLLPAFLPLALVVWFCLYPLSAAATLGAWFGAAWFMVHAFRHNVLVDAAALRFVVPALATLVVLVGSTRLDQRLGRYTLYRVPRHFVRLCCFGGVAGFLYVAWTQRPLLDNPQQIFRALGHPAAATFVLFVMIVTHFLLWRGRSAHGTWHRRLKPPRQRG